MSEISSYPTDLYGAYESMDFGTEYSDYSYFDDYDDYTNTDYAYTNTDYAYTNTDYDYTNTDYDYNDIYTDYDEYDTDISTLEMYTFDPSNTNGYSYVPTASCAGNIEYEPSEMFKDYSSYKAAGQLPPAVLTYFLGDNCGSAEAFSIWTNLGDWNLSIQKELSENSAAPAADKTTESAVFATDSAAMSAGSEEVGDTDVKDVVNARETSRETSESDVASSSAFASISADSGAVQAGGGVKTSTVAVALFVAASFGISLF